MIIETKSKLENHKRYSDIMHLPLQSILPDGTPVLIDAMTDSQITDVYELIYTASLSGDGFGVDEYPTEKDFRVEIEGAHKFVVSGKDSGKLIAAFCLITSRFYRGADNVFADPIIIVKRSEQGKGIGDFIFRNVLMFSKRLGYLGIYVDTFTNNVAMTKIIERTPGCQPVGRFPIGGKLPDGTMIGSNVYFKDLRTTEEDNTLWISTE